MAAPLLELTNVTKSFASPDTAGPLKVLDGISLQVTHSESLAIVGPSGSGKSTLLHLLGALDTPTSGRVTLDGQDLAQLDEPRLAAVRNRQVGFVFQAHCLLPHCTVLENVLVPTLAPGAPHPNATTRAKQLLQRVGLDERLGHRPAQLSGGECQRVAVVRALINQPQLLLADEPTGSLDGASAQRLAELLVELNREQGITLVVVTHSRELAGRMGRRLELRGGKLGEGGNVMRDA